MRSDLPDQKSVTFMRYIHRKIAKVGGIVFDPCIVPGATVKACSQETKSQKYMCCSRGSMRIEIMMPIFLGTFAERVLKEKLEITAGEGACLARKAYLYMLSSD